MTIYPERREPAVAFIASLKFNSPLLISAPPYWLPEEFPLEDCDVVWPET